jgi:hypothetical protein
VNNRKSLLKVYPFALALKEINYILIILFSWNYSSSAGRQDLERWNKNLRRNAYPLFILKQGIPKYEK